MSPARVKCPTCRRELDWQTAPFRPFCSERCRLVDLGAWLTEQRAIADDSAAAPEHDAAEEQAPKGSA
ncbi:MAG TPA: DNA gyrase inhibitor YacG [Steroidobacteraceae bacterium]|jgi:endogenous inhibitor of DNA gyrase (YacG/DUF329 family)|nr:DNA gyrase inhibitor YacG [Steroidobacteraceae bacterium]